MHIAIAGETSHETFLPFGSTSIDEFVRHASFGFCS
jgi:hypothetical protein